MIEGKDVNAIEQKIRKYENENEELIKLRRDQKVQFNMATSLVYSLPFMPLMNFPTNVVFVMNNN